MQLDWRAYTVKTTWQFSFSGEKTDKEQNDAFSTAMNAPLSTDKASATMKMLWSILLTNFLYLLSLSNEYLILFD